MPKHRVLICDAVDMAALVLEGDFEVEYDPKITRDELLEKVQDYDVLVVRSRTKVDQAIIEKGSRLKLVARAGTGLDNVDLRAANAKGVEVVNSPEALVEAVAEHVVGLMLSLARNIPSADASMRSGLWQKERYVGVELKGKTLGIAGLGRIGRRVGEIARVLGMTVIGYDVIEIDPAILASIGCRVVDLDTLFSSSDFLTLHVPLSPETRHMVDARRLSLMKKGAYLINTSRGEVIDEGALMEALRNGSLGGAGLDVFEKEPPGPAILAAPNVVATPHIAGQTADAQKAAISVIGTKIDQFFHKPS
jgi:D-3-phosphoglycerate dehydrogenase / 2-oxoglutarate reductase